MEIQDEKPVEDQSIDQEVAEQNVDIGDATIPTKLFDSRKEAEKAGDSEDPEDEDQYVAGFKLWTLMASLTLVMFLMMLDMSIIVTAIPRITSDFHSLGDVGWYGSAYLISSCALQPLTGKFYTHFSSKYTFIFFLGIFELGSALCGAAQSSKMLIIGRAVAGMGSSGLANGAMTIIANAAPLHKRPAILGVAMSVSQLGIVGGPLIGGALTQYATWRWCFYINLPIGGVAAVILLLINIPTRNTKSSEYEGSKSWNFAILSHLDLPGFVFFAGFAVMFLLALEWGGTTYPWNSSVIIGLFCGAGGALPVFACWEYRMGDDAMVPPSMVRRRIVICSCFLVFFFFGSMLLFNYYLPIYFQAVRGVSPALSGVYLLPQILSQMVMATVSGLLVGRWGYYLPWSVGSAVIVCVSAGLISTFTPHTSTVAWVFYQILGGIGRGGGIQMPIIAIQNDLPPKQNSVGMALVMFFQTFGGSLFLTVAQIIFDHRLVVDLREYAPTVDPQTVVEAGATAIRQVVKPEQLMGVLEAYTKAINDNFYLAAGASAAMFCFAWGIGWKKISKKQVVAPEA